MNIKFTLVLVLLFSFNAHAVDDVAKIESYLNNLNNFTADFKQVDEFGTEAGGKFYLKKPGKFRWEYDDSQPLLILSNGKRLVYYDKDLEEVTYIGVEDTLAGFLARDKIRFKDDIKLLDYTTDDVIIKVTVTQTDKPEEGNLTMGFALDKDSGEVIELVGLEITDTNGSKTWVSFNNQNYSSKIDKDKFIFKDPKFHKNVWE